MLELPVSLMKLIVVDSTASSDLSVTKSVDPEDLTRFAETRRNSTALFASSRLDLGHLSAIQGPPVVTAVGEVHIGVPCLLDPLHRLYTFPRHAGPALS